MDRGEFARKLGFRDADALDDASESLDEGYGSASYITNLPDGRWAVWEDAEPSGVSYHDTREEAEDTVRTGLYEEDLGDEE
ncbi:MAG: hypothetical protein AB1500_07600 [Bacillota bacterium]